MASRARVYLSTKEVALLMCCSEGELIHSLRCQQPVRGVCLPSPVTSSGSRRFDYHQVMTAIQSGATGPTC